MISAAGAIVSHAQWRYPAAEQLRVLGEQIELGYMRGIHKRLDEIDELGGGHGEFVEAMRRLAHRFQFDAMREIVRKGLDEDGHADA